MRLDAIGDYVLFRNSIRAIKESKELEGYRITLLGNVAFKDIAEHYDSEFINEFIWINPNLVDTYRSKERFILLFRLKLRAFDIVINPVHSRKLNIDFFVKDIKAKETIGSSGDSINLPNHKKRLSEKCYDRLVHVPDYTHFEFFRNIEFIRGLLNCRDTEIKLYIPVDKPLQRQIDITKVIIFPGAGAEYRRWSPNNFSQLIRNLNNALHGKINFFIAGSHHDNELSEVILSNFGDQNNIQNLCGRTSLVELIRIIGHSDLLISNETSAVHIAAGTNTASICISNGNHFGRFNPYPRSLAPNHITVYPDDVFYDLSVGNHLREKYKKKSNIDINRIPVELVEQKALILLKRVLKQ